MAREILIKAKGINTGEWRFGNPVYSKGGIKLYDKEVPLPRSIDEETVCQFIGLHDREKNRIFENDILQTGDGSDNYPHKNWHVYFNKVIGQYRLKNIDGPGEMNPFPLNEQGVVIGNMYDKKNEGIYKKNAGTRC